mmetsp:Transcript_6440/g.15308  ORF Transcript_6440/g.15308 Transcript_6440/m.15308 type:complete len:147 (+) Transcript_6440:693-1133(+)
MVTGKICLLDLAIEMAEKDFRLGLDFTASKASTILASSVASPESTPTPSSLTIASSFLSTVLLGELVSICFVLTMSILVAPSSFGLVLRIAVSCMYSFFLPKNIHVVGRVYLGFLFGVGSFNFLYRVAAHRRIFSKQSFRTSNVVC